MASVERQIVVAAEDDRRVRESIESLIESAGHAPVMFSSGEEFLWSGSLAAATRVITDVRMPGMDGIGVQRRSRLERPELPVIFIRAVIAMKHDRGPSTRGPLNFYINRSNLWAFWK